MSPTAMVHPTTRLTGSSVVNGVCVTLSVPSTPCLGAGAREGQVEHRFSRRNRDWPTVGKDERESFPP